MAKFAKRPSVAVAPRPTHVIRSVSQVPDAVTHQGGQGFKQDAKSELFRLAVTNMVGEKTFYETAKSRDQRFVDLIHDAVQQDPAWVARFVPFLREQMYMRSASIVMAAEYARAVLALQGKGGSKAELTLQVAPSIRSVVSSAIFRGDEPAEMISYWYSTYGRRLPMGVKRGIADAATRLYHERNALKYDGAANTWRFGDVIEQVRPDPRNDSIADVARDLGKSIDGVVAAVTKRLSKPLGEAAEEQAWNYVTGDGRAVIYDVIPAAARTLGITKVALQTRLAQSRQSALFHYLIDRTHGVNDDALELLEQLPRIAANRRLVQMPTPQRREFLSRSGAIEELQEAGFTWESISGWLNDGKGMDAKAWESIIPSMGYMALLRNLRNFDQAGVSNAVADKVAAKLTNPDEVAKSMQFPFRFLSAYKNTHSDRWARVLSDALDLSTQNVPAFDGGTLVLADVSDSMTWFNLSNMSDVKPVDIGVLFAVMVASRSPDTRLVLFASTSAELHLKKGGSVLRQSQELLNGRGRYGGGTETWQAIRQHHRGEKRILCFTDMQSNPGEWTKPKGVSFYNFDLRGDEHANAPSGSDGWYNFAGFSDKVFTALPLLEALKEADWPF